MTESVFGEYQTGRQRKHRSVCTCDCRVFNLYTGQDCLQLQQQGLQPLHWTGVSTPVTAGSSTSTLDRSVYTSHCKVFNLYTGQECLQLQQQGLQPLHWTGVSTPVTARSSTSTLDRIVYNYNSKVFNLYTGQECLHQSLQGLQPLHWTGVSTPVTAGSSTSTLDRSVYTSHCRVFNLYTGQECLHQSLQGLQPLHWTGLSTTTTARSSTSTLDRSVYTSHCRVFNLYTGQPAQCRRHVAGSGEDGEDSGDTWEGCHDPACAATGLTHSHRGTVPWNLQRMAPRRALSQSATATVAVHRSRPRNSSVKGRPTPDRGGKRRASTSSGRNRTRGHTTPASCGRVHVSCNRPLEKTWKTTEIVKPKIP